MKTKIFSTLGAALFAGAMATSVQAQNVRPTFIDVSGLNGEPTMQTILDSVYGAGAINAVTDQDSTGQWASFTSVFPTVTPVLSFEYAGNASANTLGFFSIATGLVTHDLFTGPASAGARALIAWSGSDSGTIGAANAADCGVTVNCGAFSGISWEGFGFYINGPGSAGNNFYTLDSMNGGDAMAVAYRSQRDWVIGFEDVAYAQADKDYNDMVIRVESVVAIPEPETYAMLLAGLAVMGFVARRRQRQA